MWVQLDAMHGNVGAWREGVEGVDDEADGGEESVCGMYQRRGWKSMM